MAKCCQLHHLPNSSDGDGGNGDDDVAKMTAALKLQCLNIENYASQVSLFIEYTGFKWLQKWT